MEATAHLRTKLIKLATVIGQADRPSLGFAHRDAFVDAQIKSLKLSP